MANRHHGKYTRLSLLNPRSIGRCDYSGLMVQQMLMKDQLQYRGQGLAKTGFRVNPKFYDRPNAQDLSPLVKPDPVPIINARPDNVIGVIDPSISVIQVSNQDIILDTEVYRYSNDTFNYLNFVFEGTLTADVIVSVPGYFNEFYVFNKTTGSHRLSMQIENSSATNVELTYNPLLIFNDSLSLTVNPSN